MLNFLKNSNIRLLFTGSLFTGAFIWMAITAYDVNKEEIVVFAWLSLILVGLLVAAGLVFSVVIWVVRRSRNREGLLGKIEAIEKEAKKEAEETSEPSN